MTLLNLLKILLLLLPLASSQSLLYDQCSGIRPSPAYPLMTDPSHPNYTSVQKLTMECLKVHIKKTSNGLNNKNAPLLHITVLKNVQQGSGCEDLQVFELQGIVLLGSRFSESLPIGEFAHVPGPYQTNFDCVADPPKWALHEETGSGNFTSDVCHPRGNSYDGSPSRIYRQTGFNGTEELIPAPPSTNFDWVVISCAQWKYSSPDYLSNELNQEEKHLDFLLIVNAKYKNLGGAAYGNEFLSQESFARYENLSPNQSCDRISLTPANSPAPLEERRTRVNHCECHGKQYPYFDPPGSFRHDGKMIVTEAKEKLQKVPELKGCFHLEVLDAQPSQPNMIWLKFVILNCRAFNDPSTAGKSRMKIRKVIMQALAADGLFQGRFYTGQLHNSLGCGNFPTPCLDPKDNVRYYIGGDTQIKCQNPPNFPRNRGNYERAELEFLEDGEWPQSGRGWTPIVDFEVMPLVTPINRFHVLVEVHLQLSANDGYVNPFPSEVIVFRQEVELVISNGQVFSHNATNDLPENQRDPLPLDSVYRTPDGNCFVPTPPPPPPPTTTTTTTTPKPPELLKQDFYLCRQFRPLIKYPERIPFYDVNNPDTAQNRSAWGNCFTLEAFPSGDRNRIHVRFRQDPMNSTNCLGMVALEVAIQGVNEHGYPTGRAMGSLQIHGAKIYCVNSNVEDDNNSYDRVPQASVNYPCFYNPQGVNNYTLPVTGENNVPSLFVMKSKTANDRGGFCLNWVYDNIPATFTNRPKRIQIYGEIYVRIPGPGGAPDEHRVFVLRSPQVYDFQYQNSGTNNSNCHNVTSLNGFTINRNPAAQIESSEELYKKCRTDRQSKCPLVLHGTPPTTTTTTAGPPAVVTDPTPPPTTTNPGGPIPPLPPENADYSIYDGCGITKGCIAPPESDRAGAAPGKDVNTECFKEEKRDCAYVVAWGKEDERAQPGEIVIEMQMQHKDSTEYWFALGISSAKTVMAQAFVIECVGDTPPRVHESYNIARTFRNIRLKEETHGEPKVRMLETVKKGKITYCRVAIKERFEQIDPGNPDLPPSRFDIRNTPYYIMCAAGFNEDPAGPHGELAVHSGFPRSTKNQVALGKRFSPTIKQRYYLMYHAELSSLGIIFFMTIGNIFGRYFKETFVKIKFFKYPLWLIIHVASMSTALGLFIASMTFEILGHREWETLAADGAHHRDFHSVGGFVGIGIMGMNLMLGFFVQTSRYGNVGFFSIVHGVTGHLIYGLGNLLVILSYRVAFSGMSCRVGWIVALWMFTYVIINFIFSYHYCWVDWVLGLVSGGRAFGITPMGVIIAADNEELNSTTTIARRSIQTQSLNLTALKLRRRSSKSPRKSEGTMRRSTLRGINVKLNPKDEEDPVEAPGRKIRIYLVGCTLTFATCYSFWSILEIHRVSGGNWTSRICLTEQEIYEFGNS